MANPDNSGNADYVHWRLDKPDATASAIIRPYMLNELSPLRCRMIRHEIQRQYGKNIGATCKQIRDEIRKRFFDQAEVEKLFKVFMQSDGSQLEEWRTLRKRYDKNPSKYIREQE